ncbi:MAG: enoyl-CoA hydratase/isomerase family protein [Burkholderiales bacterium]
MNLERIEFTRANGLARITIANEANSNALDHRFCREFAYVALETVADVSVRAVLIGARGKTFCVGGDLKDFLSNRERMRAHVLDMASSFHAAITHLRNGAAPVIIAVNGIAAGGGFSLVLNADLAIAKRSAKLVAAYTRSGLSPDGGGTWFLPRLVGLQKAFDLFATNPTLTADEALQLGMLSRVVDDDKFDAEVAKLVQSIIDSPPGALSSLKKLLRGSPSASFEQQLAAEAETIAESASRPSTLQKLDQFVAERSGKTK